MKFDSPGDGALFCFEQFTLTVTFAPENVASLHSPSEKNKASCQTKARNCFGTFSESTGGL